MHRAYPSLHPFGVEDWVQEKLKIKTVIGACKLNDGCSLEPRPHLQWHHLAFATEIKSIQLHDSIVMALP